MEPCDSAAVPGKGGHLASACILGDSEEDAHFTPHCPETRRRPGHSRRRRQGCRAPFPGPSAASRAARRGRRQGCHAAGAATGASLRPTRSGVVPPRRNPARGPRPRCNGRAALHTSGPRGNGRPGPCFLAPAGSGPGQRLPARAPARGRAKGPIRRLPGPDGGTCGASPAATTSRRARSLPAAPPRRGAGHPGNAPCPSPQSAPKRAPRGRVRQSSSSVYSNKPVYNLNSLLMGFDSSVSFIAGLRLQPRARFQLSAQGD